MSLPTKCQHQFSTCNSASCLFVIAFLSSLYKRWSHHSPVNILPFVLPDILVSQITSDTLFHILYPACTIFFTSVLHSPLLCIVDPKYLKLSCTFATATPCNVHHLPTALPFIIKRTCKPSFSCRCSILFPPDHTSISPSLLPPPPCSHCIQQMSSANNILTKKGTRKGSEPIVHQH